MTKSHDPPEDFILIGTLGKTFQLEGGLRFYALGEAEAQAIAALKTLFVSGRGLMTVDRVRPVGSQTILYFSGVHHAAAKALVNQDVYAAPEDLPEPAEGYYRDVLMGLPVVVDGEAFGEVADLVEAGGQELLVIAREGEEILVPLQADYVSVEDEAVVIRDPPEGLFSLHRPE